jgi:peptidoglycan/LPS O-acetylase OafA/YrhL
MTQKRYILLDGFRGLAALYVVLSHVGGESFHGLQWGNLRVDFFFVLSGFVLQPRVPQTGETAWSQARKFIRGRIFRLWPMLVTILVARLLIWGIWILRNPNQPVSDFGIVDFPTSFVAALLLLQVLVPTAMEWGDPLWSLSAEWLTNIGVALGGIALGKFVWPFTFVSGYVCLFMGSLSDTPVNLGFGAMGRALVGFSLGAIVRQINDRHVRKFWWPRFLLALALTVGIFGVQIAFHRSALPIAALVLAFFVAEVVTINQANVPISVLRVASYLGTVSFGVYAWHNNFIKLISSGLLPIVPLNIGHQSVLEVIKISAIVVAMSIVATHATSRYIEKPIQSRWAKKRPASVDVAR